jgi:peptidoglycan/xylan/chitin deacetylase (PgdA/CDA1 family)
MVRAVLCAAAILLAFAGPGSATYVVFTTDVCWSCGSDFEGVCQQGETQGVPLIARKLEEYGLKGTFFVSPYHPPGDAYEKQMLENLRFLVSRGQDIQLHTHPETFDFSRPYMNMYSRDEKKRIIATGIDNLVKAGVPRPVAHRSGGFSVDRETLDLLPEFGIDVDSSIFPLWPASKVPLPDADLNRFVRIGPVFELPVTLIRMVPWVGYRGMTPLSLDTTTAKQQETALLQAAERGLPVVTILLHYHSLYTCKSSEVPFEPLEVISRNEGNYEAFDRILKMVSKGGQFQVVTVSQLREIAKRDPQALEGDAFVPYLGLWLTYQKAWKHFGGQHSVANKMVALSPLVPLMLGGAVVWAVRGNRRSPRRNPLDDRPEQGSDT